MNKVSAMGPGIATIIENECISWYFESPETDLHKPANACSINYTNTCSSKQGHWLSTNHSPQSCTSDYGCEETLELYTRVARAHLPIMGIQTRVTSKSKIQWIPATLHNSRSIDHCKVCHGCTEAIPILDPVDVEEAYSHIASPY
jgi:hypothetical protein